MITGAANNTLEIDNRVFTSEGIAGIMNDFKSLINNTMKASAELWDLPMTSIGLTYGALNMIFGFLTGDPVIVQHGEKGIEFVGGKLGVGGFTSGAGSAVTLGSIVNYFGSINPNSEINSNYTGLNIIVGPHENTHIDQYKKYGPLFLLFYFFNGGISGNNKFEIEADKKGYEAYKNKN